MRERIPDNYDMWSAYDTKLEMERADLPECEKCGATLYEHLYRIDGKILCEDCEFDMYAEDADCFDNLIYCEHCGRPITDFVHTIDDEMMCEKCAYKSYGERV